MELVNVYTTIQLKFVLLYNITPHERPSARSLGSCLRNYCYSQLFIYTMPYKLSQELAWVYYQSQHNLFQQEYTYSFDSQNKKNCIHARS